MANEYRRFKLALYCPAGSLRSSEFEAIERELAHFQKHLCISKLYLESHRGAVSLGAEELLRLKTFAETRGFVTSGGLTPTLPLDDTPGFSRLFGAICYTDEKSLRKLESEVRTAASIFDEVIVDDFFFTNCACDSCIERRGNRSWEEFRLELMTEVSEEIFRKPAKAVNPKVKLVIKYPNWIESYPGTGYNTATQPAIFDGIYGGSETRDPTIVQQNMPRYASYSLLRWLEATCPGRNGGGWFDALDCSRVDHYLEQAHLSVFAKARELTLYSYPLHRDSLYVPPLGFRLGQLDTLAEELGEPIGATFYQPHHARGEDHLADYLGMLGIPLAPTPNFPETMERPLLLTASATRDHDVLAKLEGFLRHGGTAVVTSGFVARLRGSGIERFTTVRPTGRRLGVARFAIDTSICSFDEFHPGPCETVFPVFEFDTNATWQCIVGWRGETNLPILTLDHYGRGHLYTLTVPEDFAELAQLPEGVLDKLRSTLSEGLPVALEGPGNVGLFVYDNASFVIESFASVPTKWRIRMDVDSTLVPLTPATPAALLERSAPAPCIYQLKLAPATFQAFRVVSGPR